MLENQYDGEIEELTPIVVFVIRISVCMGGYIRRGFHYLILLKTK